MIDYFFINLLLLHQYIISIFFYYLPLMYVRFKLYKKHIINIVHIISHHGQIYAIFMLTTALSFPYINKIK